MGLSIHGKKSKKEYNYSYSALQLVRYLAILCCGAPKTWKCNGESTYTFMNHPWINPSKPTPTLEDLQEWNWALEQVGHYCPNLMFHSDAEGTYTPRGKVLQANDPHLLKGNSKGLLKELEFIKEEMKDLKLDKNNEGRMITVFETLYALVKDEVENGDGYLTFR